MKKIIIAMAVLNLMACGKVEEDQNSKLQGRLTDVTKLAVCEGSTPAGYSVYSRSWIADYSAPNGLTVHDETSVEANAFSIIRTCTYGSTQVSVIARVNASVNSSSIQTLTHDEAERKIQVGNSEQSCDLRIDAGTTFNYTFVGPCLKVISNGTSQTLIPR